MKHTQHGGAGLLAGRAVNAGLTSARRRRP